MSKVLQIINASIGYESELISDINMNLEQGKLYCLIGENGSGKSTLLKSILQDIPFLKGDVQIFSRDISEYSIRELAKKVSVVYTGRLTNNLRTNELLELGRQPYTGFLGRLKTNDLQIIEKAVNQTGIGELLHKKVDELSDGQYQKVMLTRALVQDTPILLLDEPTSFLDLNNKIQLFKLLKQITKSSNKTILFSSHDISLSKKFADELLLVHEKSVSQLSISDTKLNERLNSMFLEAKDYL